MRAGSSPVGGSPAWIIYLKRVKSVVTPSLSQFDNSARYGTIMSMKASDIKGRNLQIFDEPEDIQWALEVHARRPELTENVKAVIITGNEDSPDGLWIVRELPVMIYSPVEQILPKPKPGDAVRLTGEFSIGKIGDIGIIGNDHPEAEDELHITFNCQGQSFWQEDKVSCSGGPVSMFTPASELKATGETIKWTFWRWKDVSRAGGRESYEKEVPLWEWAGSPNAGFPQ